MSRRPELDGSEAEEDALSDASQPSSSSSPSPHAAAAVAAAGVDSKSTTKVSKGARAMHSLRNLLRSKSAKDSEKRKIAAARVGGADSAKTSGDATPSDSAMLSPPPLRAAASSSGLLSPGVRIEPPNAASASPEADSEPESVSPSSASSSGGSNSLAPSATRRSVYAQKLIHLSNSFRSLFLPSIGPNGQPSAARAGLSGFSSQPHHFTNSPAWILGKVYKMLGEQQQAQIAAAAAAGAPSASVSASSAALLTRRRRFLSDYHTRVWMTYRRGFAHIGSSSYSSDAGWGCMIRSAQMMLAHMLLTHYLGREWRKPEREDEGCSELDGAPVNVEAESAGSAQSLLSSKNRSCDVSFSGRSPSPSPSPRPEAPLPPLPAAYLRILYLFLDSPSPGCPYSIHNMLLVGGAAASSSAAASAAAGAKGGKGSSASSASSAAASSAAGFASHVGSWSSRASALLAPASHNSTDRTVACLAPDTQLWLADGTSVRADQLTPNSLLLGDDGQPTAIVPNTLIGVSGPGFNFPMPFAPGQIQTPGAPLGTTTPSPGWRILHTILPRGGNSAFDGYTCSDNHLVTIVNSHRALVQAGGGPHRRAAAFHFPADCFDAAGAAIPGYTAAIRARGGMCYIRPYEWEQTQALGVHVDSEAAAQWQADLWNWHHGLNMGAVRMGEIAASEIPLLPPSIRGQARANGWSTRLFLPKYSVPIVFAPANHFVRNSVDAAMLASGLPTGAVAGINYAADVRGPRLMFRAAELARAMLNPHFMDAASVACRAALQEGAFRDLANPTQTVFPPSALELGLLGAAEAVRRLADYIVEVCAWIVGLWFTDGDGTTGCSIYQSIQTQDGLNMNPPVINNHAGIFQRSRHWVALLGLPPAHYRVTQTPMVGPLAGHLQASEIFFHPPVGGGGVVHSPLRELLRALQIWQPGLGGPGNKQRIFNPALPARLGFQQAAPNVRLSFLAGLIDGDGCRNQDDDKFKFVSQFQQMVEWVCVVLRQTGFAVDRPVLGLVWQTQAIIAHFNHQQRLQMACAYKRTVGVGLRAQNPFAGGFEVLPAPVGLFPVVSFQVANASGRFLLADGTITHNCGSNAPGRWFGPHNACWMMKQTMEAELSRVRDKIKIGRKTKFGVGEDDDDDPTATGADNSSHHGSKANSRRSSASAASAAIPPLYSVPKIYVSDDGTLYLDKIMQLATGEQRQQREEEAAKAAAATAAQRKQPPLPEGASVSEHPLARPPLPSPPPAVPAASMNDSAAAASAAADSSASPAASASASPPPGPASAASALSHLAAAYAATSTGPSLPAASIPCPPAFTPDFHPLLLLIPLRLGVDKLNPSYIPSLLSLFQFPACVGIMGGKPRSSLYFIGVQDAMLFYLDPHTVQKSASLVGESSLARGSSLAAKHAIASSYHCSSIQSIPVRDIDPSMALGFYIENQRSLDHFWEQAKQFAQPATLAAQAAGTIGLDVGSSSASSSSMPLYPVFHVAEVSPQYSFDDSDDSDGDGEESDGVDDLDGEGEGSGSELEADFPDGDGADAEAEEDEEDDEAGGEFAKARAAMPPWPAAAVGQPQEREMTIFKRMSIDADGDAEEAAEAKRDDEAARRSESPVAVNVGSLPKDAAGRPLNMDSLTNSPVLCPQGSQQPLPVGGSPGNSLAASDSMEFNLGPTAESAAAAAAASDADTTESTGAVASLSHLTYAALGSFSSFTAGLASTASQQLAAAQQHIANGAASLHAQASALRKGSSEGPSAAEAAAAAEEAAITAALVAAYSAPVPVPAADASSSSNDAAAAAAAPSPASAAPAVSISAVSPAASTSAAAAPTPASAPVRRVKSKSKRKSSKAANAATAGSDGDEDWSIL